MKNLTIQDQGLSFMTAFVQVTKFTLFTVSDFVVVVAGVVVATVVTVVDSSRSEGHIDRVIIPEWLWSF